MSCSHEFGLISIHIYIYIFKQKASTAPQKPQLHHRGLLLFGGFNTSGLLSRSPPRLELMLSLAIVGGRQSCHSLFRLQLRGRDQSPEELGRRPIPAM